MRRIGIMVAAWMAVVVAASALTWKVIDTAGQQILAEPFQPAASSEAGEIGSPAKVTRESPSSQPTKKPGKKQTPSGTPSGKPTSSSGPTTTKSPSSPPPTVQRVWKGAAGSMEVQCTGSSIRLTSASPNDGYRAEIEGETSSSVTVHFEPKTDSGSEIKVIAKCVSGTPQFTVQNESS